jgi:hypothetical protein
MMLSGPWGIAYKQNDASSHSSADNIMKNGSSNDGGSANACIAGTEHTIL